MLIALLASLVHPFSVDAFVRDATCVATWVTWSALTQFAVSIKSPACGGARGCLWLGRINRRKACKPVGEQERCAEREQERRIEPVELVGPGAAVSAVRFPAAAS